MADSEQLTVNFVRTGMRSAVAKTQLSKANAKVKSTQQEVSRTLSNANSTQRRTRSVRERREAARKLVVAEAAHEGAVENLHSLTAAMGSIEKSHKYAFDRLKAAQRDSGPAPPTPMEFQFPDMIPSHSTSMQRSKSKRYKFESAFDRWSRDVDEAFADYGKMEAFPAPPGRCKGRCGQADMNRYVCCCRIEEAFAQIDNLEAELERWHPDRFKACPADRRRQFREMAKEVHSVVCEMVQKQQGGAKAGPGFLARTFSRASRLDIF